MRRTRRNAGQEESGNPRDRKITRVSQLYDFDNCLESGLFKIERVCSGCRYFYESLPMHKQKPICEEALKKRNETHGSLRYQCTKPWTKTLSDAFDDRERKMIMDQLDSLELGKRNLMASLGGRVQNDDNTEGTEDTGNTEEPTLVEASSSSQDAESDTEDLQSPATQRTAMEPSIQTREPSTNRPTLVEIEEPAPVQPTIIEKDGKKMTTTDVSIKSNTMVFLIEGVPTTHAVVPKAHLKSLQNTAAKVKNLRNQFQRKRFPDVGFKTKATIAVALASAPSLALTAAEFFIPTMVSGILQESGLLDYKGYSHGEFAGSFPSNFYYRSLMYDIAAECLLAFGLKLKGKMVFIACDKGNKKGVGHFVKMLATWNENTQSVDFNCLDMDASQGDTESCAIAIEFSMRKLGCGSNGTVQVQLQGQTTDSGGGGVLDSLADALKDRGLCRENYKTAPCTIHCYQLTLSVPTKKVLGEGGLNEQNLMQLLHSTYDLQEALEYDECLEMYIQAKEYEDNFRNQRLDPPDTAADQEFEDKMTKVSSFFDGDCPATATSEDKKIKKMPAPVLTRWWYVGVSCVFVFLNYLVLLRLTQIAINIYLTAARANKIASNLQPLLLEQELFSDCALLYCYHLNFFDEHMKWLQDSRDLSGRPGFQSHQILLRYYLTQKDLLQIKESIPYVCSKHVLRPLIWRSSVTPAYYVSHWVELKGVRLIDFARNIHLNRFESN